MKYAPNLFLSVWYITACYRRCRVLVSRVCFSPPHTRRALGGPSASHKREVRRQGVLSEGVHRGEARQGTPPPATHTLVPRGISDKRISYKGFEWCSLAGDSSALTVQRAARGDRDAWPWECAAGRSSFFSLLYSPSAAAITHSKEFKPLQVTMLNLTRWLKTK